jgi:hypothetical protein
MFRFGRRLAFVAVVCSRGKSRNMNGLKKYLRVQRARIVIETRNVS